MTRPRPATDSGRPLRIGVMTSALAIIGGLERCVLEDTRDLVAAGHRVEVWHRSAHLPRSDEGRDEYEELGVRLVDAPDWHFGLRTAPLDVLRFVRLGLRLRRSGLDVLWLNRPEYLPAGRVASVISGVPLAVHLHHAPNYGRIAPIAGGRTGFLAVSRAMAAAWQAAGAPARSVTIVPNGVDTDAFPPPGPGDAARARATLGIDEDVPTVLYYGRLSRSKGVVALLEAWHHVLATAPTATRHTVPAASEAVPRPPLLVLAGALYPDEAPAVLAAVAALPEGSVLLLPERDDVVPLLHAADVVVTPSLEAEGYGRTVVEAMSAGRPVVAAASGGTGEILSGDWARFTVDPTDARALAGNITGALHEAATDPTLADRCRDWVRQRHGRAAHVRELLRALRTLARR